MSKMQAVRLKKHHANNQPGELCGFPVEEAEELIRRGWATRAGLPSEMTSGNAEALSDRDKPKPEDVSRARAKARAESRPSVEQVVRAGYSAAAAEVIVTREGAFAEAYYAGLSEIAADEVAEEAANSVIKKQDAAKARTEADALTEGAEVDAAKAEADEKAKAEADAKAGTRRGRSR